MPRKYWYLCSNLIYPTCKYCVRNSKLRGVQLYKIIHLHYTYFEYRQFWLAAVCGNLPVWQWSMFGVFWRQRSNNVTLQELLTFDCITVVLIVFLNNIHKHCMFLLSLLNEMEYCWYKSYILFHILCLYAALVCVYSQPEGEHVIPKILLIQSVILS